jgi:hypothetical protein
MYKSKASFYQQRNLSPIPTLGKRPVIKKWQTFSERLPTEMEVSLWETTFPDHNLGLVMGKASGIVCLDIDTDDEYVMSSLPPSLIRKRGAKGETRFYKYTEGIKNKKILGTVELLSDGSQTIMPGSIHPDSGEEYKFIVGEDFDLDDLEELPSNIYDIMDSLKGEHPEPTGRKLKLFTIIDHAVKNKETDEMILQNIVNYDNKHHTPPWFTDPNEKLKFTPQQFIDKVRVRCSIKNPNVFTLPNVSNILKESDDEIVEFSKDNVFDKEELSLELIKKVPLPVPKSGLLKLIFNAIRSYDYKDPESFAVSGAHAITALLFARKFRIFRPKQDGELIKSLNIWPKGYYLNIANSGVGKSYVPRFFEELEETCPLVSKIGKSGSGFGSSQSIITKLNKGPVLFAKYDESSILFNKIILERRKDLGDVLCEAWTAAAGRLQAGETNAMLNANKEILTYNPCLVLMAFTTETNFSTSCSADLFRTGLMARFRCFSQGNPLTPDEIIEGAKHSKVLDPASKATLSKTINTILSEICEVKVADVNGRYMREGQALDLSGQAERLYPHEVKVPDVSLLIKEEEKSIRLMHSLGVDHPCASFVNRAMEHILEGAMEHALSDHDWAPGETARRFGRPENSTYAPAWCGGDDNAAVSLSPEDIKYGVQLYEYNLYEQYIRSKNIRSSDKELDAEDIILAELNSAGVHGIKLADLGRHRSDRVKSRDKRAILLHLCLENLVTVFKYRGSLFFVLSKYAASYKKLHTSARWIKDWKGTK